MAAELFTRVHEIAEWTLSSQRERRDPWSEIELLAVISAPDGSVLRVPAFWAGGEHWKVRFSPLAPGVYQLRSECSDASDRGLHGRETTLEAKLGASDNPLVQHGPIRVAAGEPRFEHHDGTPFFWLGDTWWMLMSDRVSYAEGFRELTADRARKGFTVVQVVVGFPPDTTPFDGRDGNEGGPPWEKGYERINPRYFDFVDQRIDWLVRAGIVPCIVGGWGYHITFMGEEKYRKHWRYLVARYGAYPVVWCLAGEGAMPYYLSKTREEDSELQRQVLARVGREVRALDAFRRPITVHPRNRSWDDVADPSLLDFHMLQSGHLPGALEFGVQLVGEARERFPKLPVVQGEPPYEGHMGTHWADTQRYSFWSTMLSGAAGFTYGAAGIFQANDRERPTGDRPDGGAFDAVFWDEALRFPGAEQIGRAKELLARLPFARLMPDADSVRTPIRWGAEKYQPPFRVYAASAGRDVRVAYLPIRYYHWDGPQVSKLEPRARYQARYVNPATGAPHELGEFTADDAGSWNAPRVPVLHDWVLVIERR